MLRETNFQAIIVAPAYRLNVFGFLASKEFLAESKENGPNRGEGPEDENAVGNFGLWDQRAALEWTHHMIGHFGGNPHNITAAGYSAGAHSVFYQLAYDLWLPPSRALISRAIMHSNSCGMQPKSLHEAQQHFDELLLQIGIPSSLSTSQKLAALRNTPAADLVAANLRMMFHEMRSVSDGIFVRKTLMRDLISGEFARRMLTRDIHIILGECRDEQNLYAHLRPPAENSLDGLRTRMLAEYPAVAVHRLLDEYYFPAGRERPADWKSWSWNKEIYGAIFADLQVYMLTRAFMYCLETGGAGHLVHRYRVEWRAKETDVKTPVEWGVTHGTDNSIWVYGEGRGLNLAEQRVVKSAFLDAYAEFVAGKDIVARWGATGVRVAKRLKADGTVDIWEDDLWEKAMGFWNVFEPVMTELATVE